MGQANEVSLFDVEDVEVQPKVRDMIVGPVSVADVKEFTRRYHYTGRPGADLWRWGLWHDTTLYGVISFNNGTRGLGAAALGPEYAEKVWHMGRLALSDKAPRNSESRLIGLAMKSMQKMFDVWAVVTYADEEVGHIGTIYQATNAIYTGTTDDNNGTTTSRFTYVNDISGERRSWRSVRDNGITELHGWTLHHAQRPKHRYVYILGSKTQRRQRMKLLRYPILPYPKQSQQPGETQ